MSGSRWNSKWYTIPNKGGFMSTCSRSTAAIIDDFAAYRGRGSFAFARMMKDIVCLGTPILVMTAAAVAWSMIQ